MKRTTECFHIPLDRRRLLKSLALTSAGFSIPGSLAEALTLTPQQTQGPFYPLANNIPLDKDNDLVQMNDHLTPASGVVTYVSGRVLDSSGNPIRNALVELWHADANGNYTYSTNSARNSAADPNFAGFGQFLTGSNGGYRFRTIKAGLYTGRARHFHWGITIPGQLSRFTTQTYWAGEAGNSSDSVLNGISNAQERASVILTYSPVPGTTTGEVEAGWDIIMGLTPMDPTYPGGNFAVAGNLVPGSPGGNPRYKVTIPAYNGYSYEIYGNPTLGSLAWAALPFSLTQMGTIDRSIHTATADGSLDIYIEARSNRGFYYVAFRVPGANKGTP
jgi:protocatechuate 3,4-dioxygenase, beta subunit